MLYTFPSCSQMPAGCFITVGVYKTKKKKSVLLFCACKVYVIKQMKKPEPCTTTWHLKTNALGVLSQHYTWLRLLYLLTITPNLHNVVGFSHRIFYGMLSWQDGKRVHCKYLPLSHTKPSKTFRRLCMEQQEVLVVHGFSALSSSIVFHGISHLSLYSLGIQTGL